MAVNGNMVALAAIGGGLVLLFGYMANANVDVGVYPDVEVAGNLGLNAPVNINPLEHVTQTMSLVPLVNTPHRYPTVTGGNITALIHHGFDPMRRHAPHDSKWIECPPAEVMY